MSDDEVVASYVPRGTCFVVVKVRRAFGPFVSFLVRTLVCRPEIAGVKINSEDWRELISAVRRYIGRQTDRPTNRQTDGQTDRAKSNPNEINLRRKG